MAKRNASKVNLVVTIDAAFVAADNPNRYYAMVWVGNRKVFESTRQVDVHKASRCAGEYMTKHMLFADSINITSR
jgi:hypothetical protein